MTSEELVMRSDLISDRSEDGQWVSKSKAAFELGVSERTIESRIKSGLINSRLVDGRREVFLRTPKLPPKVSDQPSGLSDLYRNPSERNLEPVRNPSEEGSEIGAKLSETLSEVAESHKMMMELSARVLEISEDLSDTKVQLVKKEGEIAILNNERANYNTSLQRYKDTDRELTHYRGEIEALRRENAELKKQMEDAKKSGWLGKLLGK